MKRAAQRAALFTETTVVTRCFPRLPLPALLPTLAPLLFPADFPPFPDRLIEAATVVFRVTQVHPVLRVAVVAYLVVAEPAQQRRAHAPLCHDPRPSVACAHEPSSSAVKVIAASEIQHVVGSAHGDITSQCRGVDETGLLCKRYLGHRGVRRLRCRQIGGRLSDHNRRPGWRAEVYVDIDAACPGCHCLAGAEKRQ